MQLYELENTKDFCMAFYALIPAAGIGTRFRGEIPKQYLALAGKPMLWHAVASVCVAPVQSVFVVLAPQDREFARYDWSAFAGKLEPLYCGGETRRDSVYNGMVAAMAGVDADDWMLVHDAARCLVTPADAEAVLAAAQPTGAALPVAPIADTVKRVVEGRAVETLDRSALGLALTPQAFRISLLSEALDKAARDGFAGTDCASLVERLGIEVRTCPGRAGNFKVTEPEDLERAYHDDILPKKLAMDAEYLRTRSAVGALRILWQTLGGRRRS